MRARLDVAAGAVDQNVDLPAGRDDLVARRTHLLLVEHVADHDERVASGAPDLLRFRLGRVSAPAEDDDTCFGFSEGGGDAAADHAIPARHDRDAASERK